MYDWDLGTATANFSEYDAQRKLGYSYDSGANSVKTYVGMSVISDEPAHYRAIYNDNASPLNPSWGLYDGYTDAEKWESLSGGVTLTKAGPGDVSFTLATGPHTIPSKGKLELVFALLAGDNLQDLQVNADNAKKLWSDLFNTAVGDRPPSNLPRAFALEQNYPNPFAGAHGTNTRIGFQLPQAEFVQVEVFDVLGRKLRTLIEAKRQAGFHAVLWDGRDEAGRAVHSGIYFYRLRAGNFVQMRKLVLY